MATKELYNKLLKSIDTKNLAEKLDADKRKEIADQVCTGFDIDDTSRASWLELNTRAMEIVHQTGVAAQDRASPFENAAKVIYPLLAPAIIQSTAHLVPHFKRNEIAVNIAIPEQIQQPAPPPPPPQMMPGMQQGQGATQPGAQQGMPQMQGGPPGMPPSMGQPQKPPPNPLKLASERVGKHMNWELLVASKWMLRNHKLASILTSWGMCFRKTYYDEADDSVCDELIHPKEVIINNASQTLEQANRITIINYLNKNDIISQMNLGYFNSDLDIEKLNGENYENIENDSRDDQPIFEILEQYCYLDLDDDDYYEPYIAFVHKPSETLLGVYCAFSHEDIKLTKEHEFIGIKRRLSITDYHYIDDPDGGYYSIGLNHLLVNLNDSCTAMLRNLIDSGTMANYQGGFCTKAVKTKQREFDFNKLGVWKVLETAPDTDINKAFFPLPTKEPSQVLFQLLGLLIQSSKEVGFITDVLTGDVPAQNVPATTILALIEQGTRAFKPIVEKLYYSLADEFKIRFYESKKISNEKYQKFFQDPTVEITKDYDSNNLELVPVADPSISSEAHKFAKAQALLQLLPMIPNPRAALERYLRVIEIDDIEELLTPPPAPPPPPDPKAMANQIQMQKNMSDAQAQNQQMQLKQAELGLKAAKLQSDQQKAQIDGVQKSMKSKIDAYHDNLAAHQQQQMVQVEQQKNRNEQERIRVMEISARNKGNNNSN